MHNLKSNNLLNIEKLVKTDKVMTFVKLNIYGYYLFFY